MGSYRYYFSSYECSCASGFRTIGNGPLDGGCEGEEPYSMALRLWGFVETTKFVKTYTEVCNID